MDLPIKQTHDPKLKADIVFSRIFFQTTLNASTSYEFDVYSKIQYLHI